MLSKDAEDEIVVSDPSSQTLLLASQVVSSRPANLSFASDETESSSSLALLPLSPCDLFQTQTTVAPTAPFIKRKAPSNIRKPLSNTVYMEDPVQRTETEKTESTAATTQRNVIGSHPSTPYPALSNPKKSSRPSASDFW